VSGQIHIAHTFDAGHRIVGHKGKCARLHGHTYKVEVAIRGQVHDPGFVVDFGDVKDLINLWDHRLLLWNSDPLHKTNPDALEAEGVLWIPFNPTAENMAKALVEKMAQVFELYTVSLTLWETEKCGASAFYWYDDE